MDFSGILGPNLKILSYLKSAPLNLSKSCQKFQVKEKNFMFGIKIALFGCFWATVLKKLLLHLTLSSSNLSKMNF